MKLFKEIETENGTIKIYGTNRWQELHYAKPDWSEEEEPYFNHYKRRYFLSEIMAFTNPKRDWTKDFDVYANDSFFSGVLVKISNDGEMIKAFTFIS